MEKKEIKNILQTNLEEISSLWRVLWLRWQKIRVKNFRWANKQT